MPAPPGDWAVVTGASSGIGREIALRLADLPMNLVLVALNEQSLRDLAEQVPLANVRTLILPLDLGDPGAPGKLDEATSRLEVGVLVISAGFGTGGLFLNSDLAAECAMVDVNPPRRAGTDSSLRSVAGGPKARRHRAVELSRGIPRSRTMQPRKPVYRAWGKRRRRNSPVRACTC